MTKPINETSTKELRDVVNSLHGDKNWDRSPRICALPGCGETFIPTREWQAYHSDHCRRQAYWKKNETVSVDYVPAVTWALSKLTKHKVNPLYDKLEQLLKQLKG